MFYKIHLQIDEGVKEVEADNELQARQKAICELYFDRRKNGINKSFHPIAEVVDEKGKV